MPTTIDGPNIVAPGTAAIGTLVLTSGSPKLGQRLIVSDDSGMVAPSHQVVTQTAVDYAALLSDDVILVTADGKIVTLPTAVGIAGKEFTVKLTAAGIATVATTSAQTIDGSPDCILEGQFTFVTVVSDGSNWNIVGVGGGSLTPYYGLLY